MLEHQLQFTNHSRHQIWSAPLDRPSKVPSRTVLIIPPPPSWTVRERKRRSFYVAPLKRANCRRDLAPRTRRTRRPCLTTFFSPFRKVNKSFRGRSCPIVVHCRYELEQFLKCSKCSKAAPHSEVRHANCAWNCWLSWLSGDAIKWRVFDGVWKQFLSVHSRLYYLLDANCVIKLLMMAVSRAINAWDTSNVRDAGDDQ